MFEDVPASPVIGGGRLLACSPGLALGAAAGDEIQVDESGTFRVLRHGGNLAVHVHGEEPLNVDTVDADLQQLGGCLDGGHDRLRIFTVPVTAGFPAIEAVLEAFVAKTPGAEWYFGNVYDPADGTTPLNWWNE